MPNPWLVHVKKVKLQYPQLRYKDVLVKAKKTYTPIKKPVKKPAKIGLKTGGKIVITKPIIRTRKVTAAKKQKFAKDRFALPPPQDLDEFEKRRFKDLSPATIDIINRLIELNKEQMRIIPQAVDKPTDLIPILEEEGERIDDDEDEPIEVEPEPEKEPERPDIPDRPIDPQPKEPKKPEPEPVPVEPTPIIPDKTRFQIFKDYLNSIDKKKLAKRTAGAIVLAGLAYKGYKERERLQGMSADALNRLTNRFYGRDQQLVPDYAYLDRRPTTREVDPLEPPVFQGEFGEIDSDWYPTFYSDTDSDSDSSSLSESLSDVDIKNIPSSMVSDSDSETVFTKTAPSTPKQKKESVLERPPPHNPAWSKANLIKKSLKKRFNDMLRKGQHDEEDKMVLKGFTEHVDKNVLKPALNEHRSKYSDDDVDADWMLWYEREILEQARNDADHIITETSKRSNQKFSEPTESKYDDEGWRGNESEFLMGLSDAELDNMLRSDIEHNDDFVSEFVDEILSESVSEVKKEEQFKKSRKDLRFMHNELIEKAQMKRQVKDIIEQSITDLPRDKKIELLVQDPNTEFSSITPDSDVPVPVQKTKRKTKSKSKKKVERKKRESKRKVKLSAKEEFDKMLDEIRRELEEKQREEGEAFDQEFQRQEAITQLAKGLQKMAGTGARGKRKDITRQDYVGALKETGLNVTERLIQKDIKYLKGLENPFTIVKKRIDPRMVQRKIPMGQPLFGRGFKDLKEHVIKSALRHHMKKLDKLSGGSIIDLVKAGVQVGKKIKKSIDKGMKIAEVAKRVLMDNNLRKFVHKFLGPDVDYPSFKDELHAILRLPNKKFKLASYMGPFTQVRKRLKHVNKDGSMGVKPLTQSDTVAMLHDIQYSLSKNIDDIRKADNTMIKYLKKIKTKNLDTKMNIEQGMKLIQAKITAEDMDLLARDGFIDFYDTIPDADIQMLKMWEKKIIKKLDKL
jgi:hypothetical protein